MGYFSPGDVKALDHAKTIRVVTYNDWSLDGSDGAQGEQKTANADLMGDVGPQIARTQKALSADPTAVKVLQQGGISVGSVAGMEAGHDGVVTLYVD